MTGKDLPLLRTEIPGPRSSELLARLRSCECRGVTFIDESFPIVWEAALGANVMDADGNVYVDATAAFAVASLGHNHPAVVQAIKDQASKLIHGMGDVHPTEARIELAELLQEITPADLGKPIFASSGAEAIEAAMKTAMLATGKSAFIAFEGAYHGLTAGALALTHRDHFRAPFRPLIPSSVHHLPYPDPYRPPQGMGNESLVAFCLDAVQSTLSKNKDIAAIVIEPILGRGGDVVAPNEFLLGLRRLCDESGVLLIADEILTGFCRTGKWFAVDHVPVVPDLLCVGKSMSNGFPISACLGRPGIMDAWPESTGEAIHTSTFLGHPLGCAMGVAAIREMQRRDMPKQSMEKGRILLDALKSLSKKYPCIGDVRGRGLMIGFELVTGPAAKEPLPELTWRVITAALRRGVILLGSGHRRNVVSLSPPLSITTEQLLFIVQVIEETLGQHS